MLPLVPAKETAETISLLMGVDAFMEKEEKYREGKKYNMCKALRDMMEDSRMEGHAAGLAEGHASGHAAGILVGIQVLIRDNRDAGADEEVIVEKLQKYYSLSAEEARERVREFEELS